MKFLKFNVIIGLVCLFIYSTNNIYAEYKKANEEEMRIKIERIEFEKKMTLLNDSALTMKNDLIDEVSDYIKKTSPKSKMTAEHIVEMCIEHDFDITLLLTQGHIETHFGVTNPRNNVFGLYNKRYSHPDSAVIDYIKLMKRRYIVNRTVDEALNANLNVEGSSKYFYSESDEYTKTLKKVRNRLLKQTSIKTLFDNYSIINREIASLTN